MILFIAVRLKALVLPKMLVSFHVQRVALFFYPNRLLPTGLRKRV